MYQLSVDEGNDAVRETIADASSVSPSSERVKFVIRSDEGLINALSVSYCLFHGVVTLINTQLIY